MELKIFAPLWGHEHLPQIDFLNKMHYAGYDGFDMWLPEDADQKKELLDYIQKHEMLLIVQQHQAEGNDFTTFKNSFLKNLQSCAEANPLYINSHTGKDHFPFEQNLELFDIAFEFSERSGIEILHETHRGRALYSPGNADAFFKKKKQLNTTSDFSHWVCVSESMLENFSEIMNEAFLRTKHIHARVGFEEGPQVPDPRAPEWKYALEDHLKWWDKIADLFVERKSRYLTFTTEFGPKKYMPTIPFSNEPVADQFEINCFMKDLLKERYSAKNK